MADTDHRAVRIDVGAGAIIGDLSVPSDPTGVVAFAHGAGHLFEEPGALVRVAALAGDHFLATLGSGRGG